MVVPLPQHLTGLLLEAVGRLLSVPDRPRQRKLSSDPILSDGAERSAPQFLRLDIVSFHPEHLQFGVILLGELETLDDSVHLLEVSFMKID